MLQRLIFVSKTTAERFSATLRSNPVRIGQSLVVQLEPIPSARYWRLTERLEAQRPNQQCALLPQLDPSSPFFNPEPIIWADPNHCARWAGIVESAFNPGAGLVVSPRMPRADGAVPVSAMAASGSPTVPPKISPTQAHPISASAPVPSSSKRFRRTLPHQALSAQDVRVCAGSYIQAAIWRSIAQADYDDKTSSVTINFYPNDPQQRIKRTDGDEMAEVIRQRTDALPLDELSQPQDALLQVPLQQHTGGQGPDRKAPRRNGLTQQRCVRRLDADAWTWAENE
ncbi:hypothetical protein B0A53_02907 [Rhodotorula sp. CCFEE 5036]|nr:hypothetical protein B0A53_02907 [Rhodotorula sp. CCFEE 5036]